MEITITGTDLYGLPHLGAEYVTGWSHGRRNYRRIAEVCCLCDRQRSTNTHHVVGFGLGGHQDNTVIVVDTKFCEEYDRVPYLLDTKIGSFVLYTPLFAVCGSGTTGCHGKLEDGVGDHIVEWVWYDEVCKELWEKGWMLSHGYAPHDERLFEFGYYRIKDPDGNIVQVIKHG